MSKFTMIILLLFVSAGHAFAQWGQCDPLNRTWFQTYDSLDYPTIDSICAYPPQPQPVNNCGLLGAAFVTYSDVTVMDDGTIAAFASSQDLSQYSATADVQMDTTVTMPDGSTLYKGGWSPHGFVMVNIPLSIGAANSGDVYTISSSHELNWPGCDGYGTIVSTSAVFSIRNNYGTLDGWFDAQGKRNCSYVPACSNGVTPTCNPGGFSYAIPLGTGQTCPVYRRLGSLATTIDGVLVCTGITFDATGPGPCS
jgi:hypothetical protein